MKVIFPDPLKEISDLFPSFSLVERAGKGNRFRDFHLKLNVGIEKGISIKEDHQIRVTQSGEEMFLLEMFHQSVKAFFSLFLFSQGKVTKGDLQMIEQQMALPRQDIQERLAVMHEKTIYGFRLHHVHAKLPPLRAYFPDQY
ncbi:hypothetical protein CULT_880028 [[Clostridium] ultunense Esp]|nr:hypothetical protein CULT_880028 [[Clostridium] ultunense Esp]